jgi:predicted RNase H-like nuclease (RuvC/YqgF family)
LHLDCISASHNKSYKQLYVKAEEFKKENTDLQKDAKNLKKQHKAMIDTLDSHDLLPEANQRLKTMREIEKADRKVRNKSNSMGFEL